MAIQANGAIFIMTELLKTSKTAKLSQSSFENLNLSSSEVVVEHGDNLTLGPGIIGDTRVFRGIKFELCWYVCSNGWLLNPQFDSIYLMPHRLSILPD